MFFVTVRYSWKQISWLFITWDDLGVWKLAIGKSSISHRQLFGDSLFPEVVFTVMYVVKGSQRTKRPECNIRSLKKHACPLSEFFTFL